MTTGRTNEARAKSGTKTQRAGRAKNAGPLVPRDRHVDGTFSFDPEHAVAHLRGADESLARIIDVVGPFAMELKSTHSVFVALAEAIVHQQLNGKAARTIFERVCALFPDRHEGLTPSELSRLSDETLRSAGLSGSKLLSLRDLATKAADGTLPSLGELHGMDDEEVIERLTAVRGIGRWTAEMFLVFRLGRPDVLPVDDYGVRKGFSVAFRKRALAEKKDLEKRGARWTPYRTVATWYLWRAVELEQDPATKAAKRTTTKAAKRTTTKAAKRTTTKAAKKR